MFQFELQQIREHSRRNIAVHLLEAELENCVFTLFREVAKPLGELLNKLKNHLLGSGRSQRLVLEQKRKNWRSE